MPTTGASITITPAYTTVTTIIVSTTPTRPPSTVTMKSPSATPSTPTATCPEGARLYHEAFPAQYHFTLNEPDVCQRQRPFLVLMVPVHPGNARAREVIRSTWGNETLVQGKVVTTLFVLGALHSDAVLQEKVRIESERHRDILQSDFIDSYLNLTIKTMVIMDWLASYCPGASYAMKIDSDMFLNMENLMKLLLMPQTPKQNYITGKVLWNIPVIRNPQSKWYVPETLYPESTYPTYLLGMGYLFSNDLPEKLVQVSKDIKPFNIEDAYIGMCLKHLGIDPSTPPDPSQFKSYASGPFKRCDYVKVITTILGNANQLLQYWQDFKKGGPPC